jgi:hypothetical protein
MAPDLPGYGETGPEAHSCDAYFDGLSHNLGMLHSWPESITGVHHGDVREGHKGDEERVSDCRIIVFARKK